MGSLYKRSLTKHGGSYEVILPKGWVEFYHLKAGDEITMVVDDLLIICPPGLENKARAIMEKQTAQITGLKRSMFPKRRAKEDGNDCNLE